jgi:hypothetical protein
VATWFKKPHGRSTINRGHPLASSLIFAYDPALGGHRDLVSLAVGTPTNTTIVTRNIGGASHVDNTGAGATTNFGVLPKTAQLSTLTAKATWFVVASSLNGNVTDFTLGCQSDAGAAVGWNVGYNGNVGTVLALELITSGTNLGVGFTFTPTANKFYAMACSYDGSLAASGVKWYVDGVAQTTTVNTSGTGTAVASTNSLLISGIRNGSNAQAGTSDMGLVYIFNRVLTPAEIQFLSANPLALLDYGVQPLFVRNSANSASGTGAPVSVSVTVAGGSASTDLGTGAPVSVSVTVAGGSAVGTPNAPKSVFDREITYIGAFDHAATYLGAFDPDLLADPSGGTTFTKSVSGSITPAGVLSRSTVKLIAATITAAGVIVRSTLKNIAGTISSTGTIARQTAKNLAGTISSTGAIAKQTSKLLSGTISTTGTLVRQTNKALSGTISSTGTWLRSTSKNIAGTISMTGALATIRVVLKALSGTISATGTLSKQTNKLLAATISATGAISRSTVKNIAGTISSTGTVARQTVKNIAGTISSTGTLAKSTVKNIAGTISSTGVLVKSTVKNIAGAISSTGTLVRQTLKQLAGTISLTGTVARVRVVLLALSGTISMTGTLTKQTSKALAATISATGAVLKSTIKQLAGTIFITGTLTRIRVVLMALSGTISLSGTMALKTLKNITGSISLTGVLVKLTTKSIAGTISTVGVLSKSTIKLLSGGISLTGTLVRQTVKALAGTISGIGNLTRTTFKSFTGSIALAGALAGTKIFLVFITATIGVTGVIQKSTIKMLSGSVNLTGSLIKRTSKNIVAAITLVGLLLRKLKSNRTNFTILLNQVPIGAVVKFIMKPMYKVIASSSTGNQGWLELSTRKAGRRVAGNTFVCYVIANDPVNKVLQVALTDNNSPVVLPPSYLDVPYDALLGAQMYVPATNASNEAIIAQVNQSMFKLRAFFGLPIPVQLWTVLITK